ncbi:response regulator [Halobacillus rhizosphaerae]|uniref:response regulator transcription factor n=1 Tax=Halobacillus rhizosphaerae TaxID=3064889 RepID=UPI00398B9E36
MTLKIIIVDDEPIIRRGLAATIPWEENQIEVMETAEDGKDAIKKIRESEAIDLVVTDVRMPNMDGLELAGYLAENYPNIKILMISGYDDFKYAQRALKLGVQDYLLKPVDIEELLRVVTKIKNETTIERNESEELRKTQINNAIFHQIWNFPVKVPQELKRYGKVSIYPFITMLKKYASVTYGLTKERIQQVKRDWKNDLESRILHEGYEVTSVFTGDNILLTCIIDPTGTLTSNQVKAFIHQSEKDITGIIYQRRTQLGQLFRAHAELIQSIKYLPLKEDRSVTLSQSDEPIKEEKVYPSQLETDLLNAFFQLNDLQVRNLTNQLFAYFKENQFFLEDVVKTGRTFFSSLIQRYENLFRQEPVYPSLNFRKGIDVYLFNDYQLLKELFIEDLDLLIKELKLSQTESNDWLIERAVTYIHSYFTSDVKAHEVANVINISPNYFSSLFKQKTGKKFNEYVNELRVNKAKSLLEETPFKVIEIAEQVGYQEYKYFVKVFKRYTGMTPTKYRRLMTIKS